MVYSFASKTVFIVVSFQHKLILSQNSNTPAPLSTSFIVMLVAGFTTDV
jgi:hypothetical protein